MLLEYYLIEIIEIVFDSLLFDRLMEIGDKQDAP